MVDRSFFAFDEPSNSGRSIPASMNARGTESALGIENAKRLSSAQKIKRCGPSTMTILPTNESAPPLTSTTRRSEEHTSELQSLMRISYAVFCLKKKKPTLTPHTTTSQHHQQTSKQ